MKEIYFLEIDTFHELQAYVNFLTKQEALNVLS